MKALWNWLRNEPAAVWTTVAGAVIGVLTTFNLHVTDDQKAAILGFIAVVAGLIARQQVTPTAQRKAGKHTARGAAFTVTRRRIPELVVPGKPLGRHVHHDSRSLNYLVPKLSRREQRRMTSVSWQRETPILDQGDLGSCTGNAACGVLGTDPFYGTLSAQLAAGQLTLDEREAVALYSLATQLDSYKGTYPPTDTGSDGLSVAKAAQKLGLIASYQHITSIAAAKSAILSGPFIVGSDWYSGMDDPDSTGLVAATGTVRGGHEYACYGYDADKDLWWFDNSWASSWGLGGRFSYSSKTFAQLLAADGDATVFTPIAVPAPTPVPSTPTVVVEDPAMVAYLEQRAKALGESAAAFLLKALHTLYRSVK